MSPFPCAFAPIRPETDLCTRGIVYCSPPRAGFWFNPVQVLMDELLAGAQIALPGEVLTVLDLLRLGSKVMFGLFIAAVVLAFVMVPLTFLVFRSRIWCIPIVILSILTTVCSVGGTVLATVFSLAAKYALTLQSELNITADISPLMIASTWIPALLITTAFFLHSAVGCCCHIAPTKTEEKREKQASGPGSPQMAEKKKKRHSVHDFINKKRSKRAASSAVSGSRE